MKIPPNNINRLKKVAVNHTSNHRKRKTWLRAHYKVTSKQPCKITTVLFRDNCFLKNFPKPSIGYGNYRQINMCLEKLAKCRYNFTNERVWKKHFICNQNFSSPIAQRKYDMCITNYTKKVTFARFFNSNLHRCCRGRDTSSYAGTQVVRWQAGFYLQSRRCRPRRPSAPSAAPRSWTSCSSSTEVPTWLPLDLIIRKIVQKTRNKTCAAICATLTYVVRTANENVIAALYSLSLSPCVAVLCTLSESWFIRRKIDLVWWLVNWYDWDTYHFHGILKRR